MVVLDEADEMLDMGFAEDLEAILEAVPETRQTALFSATMAPAIRSIANRHLRNPVLVHIARERVAPGEAPRVREVAFVVQRRHKVAALARVLDMESPTSAIVFCRTRTEVDELTETLGARGYRAEALHGGLSQEQRDRVMRRFRDGASELLVATDVAARGLDIEHVSHVVNFDVPSSPDAYVHRVGRTGRAGREGVAITLSEAREHRLLRNIEQATKRKISIESVPTIHDLARAPARPHARVARGSARRRRVGFVSRHHRIARRGVRCARYRRGGDEVGRHAPRTETHRRTKRFRTPRSRAATNVRTVSRVGRDAAEEQGRAGMRATIDRCATRSRGATRPTCAAATRATSRASTSRSAGRPACVPAISSAQSPTRRDSIRATSARSRSPIGSRWSKFPSPRLTKSFARSAPRPSAASA